MVYKPWKTSPSLSRIHMVTGCQGHSAVRWFVVVGVGRGMRPLGILQNQLTLRKHVSCRPKRKKERNKKRKRSCCADRLAEGTGWELSRTSIGLLLPGFVPNLRSWISKGNVTSIGMSRHKPRQIPGFSCSLKVGTLNPTLSRAHHPHMANLE